LPQRNGQGTREVVFAGPLNELFTVTDLQMEALGAIGSAQRRPGPGPAWRLPGSGSAPRGPARPGCRDARERSHGPGAVSGSAGQGTLASLAQRCQSVSATTS
jgi:hypothetical protein